MPASSIKKLVVLMLENRSFDNILGFHRPWSPDFDGLKGSESLPLDTKKGGPPVQVKRMQGSEGYVTQPDPRHEHADAMVHLFGSADPNPPQGAEPTNHWFVEHYAQTADGAPLSAAIANQAISAFDTATQLPAIAALATHFTVFDRWFSSLPGPTFPNRFFAHCGTSGGLCDSPGDLETAWDAIGRSPYQMTTLYDRLDEKRISWGLYFHDLPQALVLESLHGKKSHLHLFDTFLAQAKNGTLPSYSFLEPAYFHIPLVHHANDMHPPHDVKLGDQLVADVYNALRSNDAQWKETALLVVWDEHGGYYDHVPPPATYAPDDASMDHDAKHFQFYRLGVRVPAILVSPWCAAGVNHTQFDHASIVATVRKQFGTGDPISDRDAKANTFDVALTLDTPRSDTPAVIGAPASVAKALSASPPEIYSSYQNDLLTMANKLGVAPLVKGALGDASMGPSKKAADEEFTEPVDPATDARDRVLRFLAS